MEKSIEEVERDRWVRFLDAEGVGELEREWVVELGVWFIRPTTSRPGWWQVRERGSWSVVLPYEAAEMLWSGIRAHFEQYGAESLMPDNPPLKPLG